MDTGGAHSRHRRPLMVRWARAPRGGAVAAAAAMASCALGCSAGLAPAAERQAPPPAVRTASGAPSLTSAPAATEPRAAPTAEAKAGGTQRGGPYNVLLITVDAMRADMPWNGYPRDIAPALTALARRAVTYARAYSVSSYTAMSVGGFLAGRWPSELERSGFFFSAYPDSVTMFPELLQRTGVRTLAAQAHFYFDTKSGFRQGFDDYRMVPGIRADNKTDPNVTSPEHLALAIAMLSERANTAGRFFAWFHFMDPHDRYVRHEGIDFGSRARDRYDGEIRFTDEHVGRLLDFVAAQPWADRTAIVVNSDHGEVFGEHGQSRHGFELWEPLVHVPLMFVIPGVAARRIDEPRSMLDVVPTIFELLGVSPDPSFAGTSLWPEIREPVPLEPREVIVDLPRTSDNDRRRAMIWGRYKLLAFGDDFRFELYDLETDPQEVHDLRLSKPELFRELRARYERRVRTIHDICPTHRDKLMGKHKSRPC